MSRVIKFFALAYFISWLIWLPLYLPYFGINFLPVLPFQHGLGALGPLVAGFIMSYREKRSKHLVQSMFAFRKPILFFVALFAPFMLLMIAASVDYIQTSYFINLNTIGHTKEFPQFNLITYFIYNLLFFGFGEETGWKGYALPRLQAKFTALTSSILFTFFWASWHIPLFFYRPGYMSMSIAGIAGWFFSLLTGSILLTWFFNASKGSILVCAVFHATVDVAFVSDFTNQNTITYLGALITFWGIATIPILKSKNRQRVIVKSETHHLLKIKQSTQTCEVE